MRKSGIIILAQFVLIINAFAQLPVKKNGKFIEVNRAQIYYEEYGQGEPLFLLHGFFGTTENWREFIESYSKNYKVIAWDMRGHGRSTNPDTNIAFKHEQVARDLLDFMNKLKITKARAIGHSSGGITILYAATIAPERFEAIIPVSAQTYYSQPVRDWVKGRAWEQHFSQAELDSLHGRKKGDRLKKQFYNFSQLYGDPSLTQDQLQKISVRTLVVHGDNDFVPVSQAWEMFQSIHNSRIWISPNTGHMPQYGKGNDIDFVRRTLEFLKGDGW